MKLSDLPVLKMEFLTTRKCQLKCSYCKISRNPKLWSKKEMTTEQAISVIDMMADYWPGAPVILYGGEPTTRRDLPQLIAHSVSRGVKHAVISNSLKLTNDSYRKSLVDSGLSNWSISYDGYSADVTLGDDAFVKSSHGLGALFKMRDEHGIKDLVACITVSKANIDTLPDIVDLLTREGIWSICTPLQLGGEGYDYSQGKESDLPSQEQLSRIAPKMVAMAESGSYLMHNGPEWFAVWEESFRAQNWFCHDKSVLTVDADGSLRYCVDIRLPEPIYIWELKDPEVLARYVELLKMPTPCTGCFWDPCYEGTHRALSDNYGIEKGRQTFRHELSEDQINKLLPEAQAYMRRKS